MNYRFIKIGEVILKGDQYWSKSNKKWENVYFAVGVRVSEDIGNEHFRRRITNHPQTRLFK